MATIDLLGPKGERFDYLTMDEEDHCLLSAHLGPGILYVIDVQTNKLVQAIPGVPGITGVEYVPGLRKVYTSDWGEEKIGIVDLQTIKVVKRPARAAKPNGSTYAAPFHKVYVVNTLAKFDPGLRRIYAACSSGFTSVFQQDDADHYRKLEDFAVQKMMHSLAMDTATHRVYAPEQQENGPPVVA